VCLQTGIFKNNIQKFKKNILKMNNSYNKINICKNNWIIKHHIKITITII